MLCPYCEKEMQKGWINQERFSLKWVPDEDRGFMECLVEKDVIKLTALTKGGRLTVYHCENCRKFIIDENDIEV